MRHELQLFHYQNYKLIASFLTAWVISTPICVVQQPVWLAHPSASSLLIMHRSKSHFTMAINTFQRKNIIRMRLGGGRAKNLFETTVFSRKVPVLKWLASSYRRLQCYRIWETITVVAYSVFQEAEGRGCLFTVLLYPTSIRWAQTVFSLGEISCALNPPCFLKQDCTITELSCLTNVTKICSSHKITMLTLADPPTVLVLEWFNTNDKEFPVISLSRTATK